MFPACDSCDWDRQFTDSGQHTKSSMLVKITCRCRACYLHLKVHVTESARRERDKVAAIFTINKSRAQLQDVHLAERNRKGRAQDSVSSEMLVRS